MLLLLQFRRAYFNIDTSRRNQPVFPHGFTMPHDYSFLPQIAQQRAMTDKILRKYMECQEIPITRIKKVGNSAGVYFDQSTLRIFCDVMARKSRCDIVQVVFPTSVCSALYTPCHCSMLVYDFPLFDISH